MTPLDPSLLTHYPYIVPICNRRLPSCPDRQIQIPFLPAFSDLQPVSLAVQTPQLQSKWYLPARSLVSCLSPPGPCSLQLRPRNSPAQPLQFVLARLSNAH